MYVFSNKLMSNDGKQIAEFSSHWAAVAAMIRQTDPEFKSLSADKPEDLKIELKLKAK